jgi:hypothetical protein
MNIVVLVLAMLFGGQDMASEELGYLIDNYDGSYEVTGRINELMTLGIPARVTGEEGCNHGPFRCDRWYNCWYIDDDVPPPPGLNCAFYYTPTPKIVCVLSSWMYTCKGRFLDWHDRGVIAVRQSYDPEFPACDGSDFIWGESDPIFGWFIHVHNVSSYIYPADQ